MSRQSVVDDIIDELATSTATRDDERRRHVRRTVRLEAQALTNLSGERHWIRITLRDVSPSGLGLICPRLFYVGEYLVVRLEFFSPTHKPKHAFCQVKACRYLGRRLYQIGAEFKDAMVAGPNRDYFPDSWFQILHAPAK